MIRTYMRSVARKNILGIGQTLESKQRHLVKVSLEGILSGTDAETVMNQLEIAWVNGTVAKLVTPTYYGGENAVITELEFSAEQIKYYERQIPFRIDFLLLPDTTVFQKPSWQVLVANEIGVYVEPVGLIELNIERQFGGQAASFDMTFDNRDGQNALVGPWEQPVFDYFRNVKIYIGYNGVNTIRLWGLIDTVDYTVTKGGGSTVRVTGRDYMAKLAEGTNFDGTYIDMYPQDMMEDLIGTRAGLSTAGLGSPNWAYWAWNPWVSYLPFNDSTILEAIEKISSLYKMYYWMDSGEHYGTPTLMWKDHIRISAVVQPITAGNSYLYVKDPILFSSWVGETLFICANKPGMVPAYADMVQATAVDLVTGKVTINPAGGGINFDFPLAWGPVLSTEIIKPAVKKWGIDIVSLQVRVTGVPMRNRVAVYGEGAYSIADTNSPTLFPSGQTNPCFDLNFQARYGRKQTIITDGTLKSPIYCDVLSYSTLFKLLYPENEIRITVIGDPELLPGSACNFTDDGITGLAGTYFLTGVIDKLGPDGYIQELVLRRFTQVISPNLLSGVFTDIAKGQTGTQSLQDSKAMFPAVGEVLP
jgi:hypothetical protein